MVHRSREFVDSRLRRCPPDRASAVPYGQAGENALRFPHPAHRSAAAHKLHGAAATARIDSDSGSGETFNRLPALAYSSRNLSKRPGPPQKLDPAKRREIAESVISGRKTGAEMARLYNVSAPTVSRIVAARRTGLA
jgi:hypothetical protein